MKYAEDFICFHLRQFVSQLISWPLIGEYPVSMYYLRNMQCPRWDSISAPLALYATALQTELKEISTNAVSKCSYEHTTVPLTLSKRAFPLHLYHVSDDASNIPPIALMNNMLCLCSILRL